MLVRRVGADDAAELVGLAAIVWVAADEPCTVAGLAAEVGAEESTVAEAVSMLTAAGWLCEVA